jgi:hypothetical protein
MISRYLYGPLALIVLLAAALSGCFGSDEQEKPSTTPSPAAVIAADPTVAYVGTMIQFDGSSSTGNGLKYQWDFGDGSSATAPTTQHAYAKPGKYSVSLKVTDTDERVNEALLAIHVHHLSQYGPTLTPANGKEDYQVQITTMSQGFRANLTYPTGTLNSVALNLFLPNGTLYSPSAQEPRSSGPVQYCEYKIPPQTLAENGYENWKAQVKLSAGFSVYCNLTIEVYY